MFVLVVHKFGEDVGGKGVLVVVLQEKLGHQIADLLWTVLQQQELVEEGQLVVQQYFDSVCCLINSLGE